MMILPYLDYGDIVYSATNINQLNKLQCLQNYCLTICLRTYPTPSVAELHRITGLNLLEKRREHHLLNHAHTRTLNPNNLDTRPIYTRVHGLPLLKVSHPKSTKFTKSVGYKSAILWNSQPNHLRAITNYAAFKSTTKIIYKNVIT